VFLAWRGGKCFLFCDDSEERGKRKEVRGVYAKGKREGSANSHSFYIRRGGDVYCDEEEEKRDRARAALLGEEPDPREKEPVFDQREETKVLLLSCFYARGEGLKGRRAGGMEGKEGENVSALLTKKRSAERELDLRGKRGGKGEK